MSYDIYLVDPESEEAIQFDKPHCIHGGNYALGCTKDAWLNITYNYASHFKVIDPEKGIRAIYGLTGAESIPILKKAIDSLKDDIDPDYWKATEGNARQALQGLYLFATRRPDGIWVGD